MPKIFKARKHIINIFGHGFMDKKQLLGKKVIVRHFKKEDAIAASALFSDEEAMRLLGLLPALSTLRETEQRINRWISDGEHFALIEKETGLLIGYIAVNPDSEEGREDTRELGFMIIKDKRRNGYALDAIQTVLKELTTKGIKYVWACCFDGNEASRRLIEKAGFQLVNIGTYEPENDHEYSSFEYRIELKRSN